MILQDVYQTTISNPAGEGEIAKNLGPENQVFLIWDNDEINRLSGAGAGNAIRSDRIKAKQMAY